MTERISIALMAAIAAALVLPLAVEGAFPGRAGRIVVANRGSILMLRTDGNGLVVLTHGYVDCSPVWSPDGRRVAFARARRDPSRAVDCHDPVDASIYIVDAAGTNARVLARNAVLPTWSPGGKRLAFYRASGLFVMRSDGTAQRRIAAHRLYVGPATAPDWSPNGVWIAFDSHGKLELVHPDGTDLHQIVTAPPLAGRTNAAGTVCISLLSGPDWSPNGNRIAYTNIAECQAAPGYRSTETSAIVSIDRDGNDPTMIVDPATLASDPTRAGGFSAAWSPDGTQIAFNYYTGVGDQIGIVNVTTGNATNLHHELDDEEDRGRPDWQPLPR